MGATNDPNNDVQRFQNQIRLLEDTDRPLHDADRDQMLAFAEYCFSEKAASTAGNQTANVRKHGERAAEAGLPPVTEWESTHFDRYTGRMKRGDLPGGPDGGWSEGTIRNVRQHFKNFLTYLGREWAEEIEMGAVPDPKVRRSDCLTQEEISAINDVAEHPRDRALFALPLATMQRSGALRALRIKDIHLPADKQTGYITINSDANGQKRATGKRPLHWATAYAEDWLAVHPRRDDPDAPFLCVITDSGKAVKGSAISKTSYNNRLRTLAKRAGLPEERYKVSVGRKEKTISCHRLRHTAITRAALNPEFSDQIIKTWAGWTPNSSQLENYIHTEDDDVLAAVDDSYADDGDTLAHNPTPDECPKCGYSDPGPMNACPNCTMLLTAESAVATATAEEANDEATEAAVESTDEDMIRLLNHAREGTDDEVLGELLNRIAEGSSAGTDGGANAD